VGVIRSTMSAVFSRSTHAGHSPGSISEHAAYGDTCYARCRLMLQAVVTHTVPPVHAQTYAATASEAIKALEFSFEFPTKLIAQQHLLRRESWLIEVAPLMRDAGIVPDVGLP
jgi:hypothetical protein